MESFERDGLTFPVVDRGPADGEPVVLLHGFPGSSATWAEVGAGLVGEGLRVLAPDQRGYSPRARPPGRRPYRLAELVDDVVALADAAGLRRFHLAGHDWGAVVGWALAAGHPERVASLTALATPHPAAMAGALGRGQALRSAYVGLFWLPAVPERLLLAGGGVPLRRLLGVSGLSPRWAEAYAAAMIRPGALSGALAWYRALTPGLGGAVGPVAVPTSYVRATGDATVSPAAAAGTARFVTGPYRFDVAATSHWLPEDHAPLVVGTILQRIAG